MKSVGEAMAIGRPFKESLRRIYGTTAGRLFTHR
jgi:carbamoylphosphate synthase large subunit